jgi:ubiquinone biosynthesis protein Coq4
MMTDEITLKQGIEQFHDKNKQYFADRPYFNKGLEFIKCHDIAHVVFGCDTKLYGEDVVKIWTTFGTTLSFWKVVNGYHEVNAFKLFRMYSVRHIIKNILRLLLVIPQVIVRSNRMSKPRPFSAYKPYFNTPLSEIRSEFNIRVLWLSTCIQNDL